MSGHDIGAIVNLLCDQLNGHLSAASGPDAESREQPVVLMDGEKLDPLTFKSGAVSVLLVNIEEENTLRGADPFGRNRADGTGLKVQPEIHLNLYVLFVARYKEYAQGLTRLSAIVDYFQSHRVLDHRSTPALSSEIDRLVLELVTLSFSEQNEIWGALRTTYHPSLLYRVNMIVFRDEEPKAPPELEEPALRTSQ